MSAPRSSSVLTAPPAPARRKARRSEKSRVRAYQTPPRCERCRSRLSTLPEVTLVQRWLDLSA